MKTKLGRLRSLEIPGTTGSFDSARIFFEIPGTGRFFGFWPVLSTLS